MTHKEVASTLIEVFRNFRSSFQGFSSASRIRFEKMLWQEQRVAMQKRMALHEHTIDKLASLLQEKVDFDNVDWKAVAKTFVTAFKDDPWLPVAISFYNSVIRQAFEFQGLTAIISVPNISGYQESISIYDVEDDLQEILIQALTNFGFTERFERINEQAQQLTNKIHERVSDKVLKIVFHRHLFFRNKQAYAIGKLECAATSKPIAIALQTSHLGISIKAVLLDEESIKNVFSFSRSYFLVDSESPCGTIDFLLSIMPSKPKAQLFINLGYQELGKELLLQNLNVNTQLSDHKFTYAPGIPGMVMFVFYHPSSDYVFKVVRGTIKPPKNTTEKEVIEKYRFVAQHDRAGRMADAQQFKNLALPEKSFELNLKRDLLLGAPDSISERNGYLVFRNIFIERKLEPLNLYFLNHSHSDRRAVILDYGKAIKEMVISNIFPGDLLLKNFGVTGDQKVVFYDYDEVVALSDCTFKKIRQPKNDEDEFASEYPDVVLENDIFPEELLKFLLPEGPLREAFLTEHADLFSVDFWEYWKQFNQQGKFIDLQPYQPNID